MEDVAEADYNHFVEKMWPNIKEIYNKNKSAKVPEADTTITAPDVTSTEVPEKAEAVRIFFKISSLGFKCKYFPISQPKIMVFFL